MGYFSINCTFLPGSLAKGCAIEVFNETMDLVFKQNISRLLPTSSYAVDNISLSINGTYTIYVYVWDKYGRVNKSLVVLTKRIRVAISYQEDKNDNMSINGIWSIFINWCYNFIILQVLLLVIRSLIIMMWKMEQTMVL